MKSEGGRFLWMSLQLGIVTLLAVCVVESWGSFEFYAGANGAGGFGGSSPWLVGGSGSSGINAGWSSGGSLAGKPWPRGGGPSGPGGSGGNRGGGGGGGGWGSGGGKPLRGSQVYLQDPWDHEHNYHGNHQSYGPGSKHGWGSSGGHLDSTRLPDSATYVQKLIPVLNLGSKLKRISSHLQQLHPGFKWQKPSLAVFGLDGSPHPLHGSGGGGHGGQYENDGWGSDHSSHHVGHSVNKRPHYSTW